MLSFTRADDSVKPWETIRFSARAPFSGTLKVGTTIQSIGFCYHGEDPYPMQARYLA